MPLIYIRIPSRINIREKEALKRISEGTSIAAIPMLKCILLSEIDMINLRVIEWEIQYYNFHTFEEV